MQVKCCSNMVLMILLLICLTVVWVPGQGFTEGSTTPPYEKAGTDLRNFAAGADLATVVINREALKTCVKEYSFAPPEAFPNVTLSQNGTEIVVNNNFVKKAQMFPGGSFTVTYKKVATLSNGDMLDLVIESGDIWIFPRSSFKYGLWPYQDSISVFDTYPIKDESQTNFGPSVKGSSLKGRHAGIRMDNFRIYLKGDNLAPQDTFFFTIKGLNVDRTGNDNFKDLVFSDKNFYFSETAQVLKGYDSNIYLPSTSSGMISNSYEGEEGFIFSSEGTGNKNGENYNSGFALLGKAQDGLFTKLWTSVPNKFSTDFYILVDGITYTITSSSGYYGKIETFSDGTLNGKPLYGGRFVDGKVNQKRTYDVPIGKTVTYKMTPEDGYILDKLVVDNKKVEPTSTIYDEAGKIEYYTYTFPDDPKPSDHKIHVTWQPSVEITFQKIWDDDNNAAGKRPESLNMILRQNISGTISDKTYEIKPDDAEQQFSNMWKHVFYNLPKYSNYDEINNSGVEIGYSFIEELVDGYLTINPASIVDEIIEADTKYYAAGHSDSLNVRGFNEESTKYNKYNKTYQITNRYQRPTSIELEVAKEIDGRKWKEDDSFTFDLYQTAIDAPLPERPTVTVSYPADSNNCRFVEGSQETIVIGKSAVPISLGWDLLYNNGKIYTIDEGIPGVTPGTVGRVLNIRIKERPLSSVLPYNGFTAFAAEHSAHVVLTAEEDEYHNLTGKLTATVYYGEKWKGSPEESKTPTAALFKNTYEAKPTKISLSIHKLLNGKPAAGFRFVLIDKNGTTRDGIHMLNDKTITDGDEVWGTTVKSEGTGLGSFSGEVQVVEFTKPGQYHFILKEVVDSDRQSQGVTFDTKEVHVTVSVTDDMVGKLTADVTYSENAGPQSETNKNIYGNNKGATFENTYDSIGTAKITATKALDGRLWTSADAFPFDLTPIDGAPFRVKNGEQEVEVTSLRETATEASKTISFQELIFHLSDLDDANSKVFSYKLHEDWQEGVKGITPVSDQTIRIQVSDPNRNGKLTIKYADPSTSGEETVWLDTMPELTLINTYTINDSKKVTLRVQKEILDKSGVPVETWKIDGGHDWTNTSFHFVLLTMDMDTPMPMDAKNRTDEVNGKYSISIAADVRNKLTNFAEITYTKPGTYHYVIREQKAKSGDRLSYVSAKEIYIENKLVYSGTAHSVTVQVDDDGEGKLKNPVIHYGTTGETPSVFHNQQQGDATLLLGGKKELTGHPLEAGMFNFELIQLVPKEGAANIKVSDITWNELNSKSLVSESKFDKMKLIDHGSIGAQSIVDKQLEYTRSDLGDLNEKTFYYAGIELKQENPGITYSPAVHFYEVTLKAEGSNSVYVSKVKITDSSDTAYSSETIFDKKATNTYVVPSEKFPTHKNSYVARGTATINVRKSLEGRIWKDEDNFKFRLIGDGKNEIIEIGNTENHTGSFSLSFNQKDLDGATTVLADGARQKEFVYTIHEACYEGTKDMNPSTGGYTKNGVTYAADQQVTVRVTDQNNGTLRIEFKSGERYIQASNLLFTNRYAPSGHVPATIKAYKQLTGRDWRSGTQDSFTFMIEPVSNTAGILRENMPMPGTDGNQNQMTITGNSPGVSGLTQGREGSFQPITFTKPGEYIYEIEEVKPENGLPGISYTSAERRVKVDIADDLNGGLTLEKIHYETLGKTTPSVFVNTYTPDPVTVSFAGKKEVVGRQLFGAKYSFDLYETGSDFSISGKTSIYNNTVSGDGEFATHGITYNKVGNWYYVLKEYIPVEAVAPNYILNGIQYDNHDCRITVTVTDDPEEGKLKAAVTYNNVGSDVNNQKAYFINRYRASGEAEISVTKVLEGIGWGNKSFEFKLQSVSVGTEPSPIRVKNGTDIVDKTTEGLSAATDPTHKATFEKLVFDETHIGKTYKYNLTEVLPTGGSGEGIYESIKYDLTSYPVNISVIDNENGKLNFHITYGSEGKTSLSIANTYQSLSFAGHLIWVDGIRQHTYENMANEVTLKLFRNTDDAAEWEEVSGLEPDWSGSGKVFSFKYDNLPMYDNDGKKYIYTVQEMPITEYLTSYEDNPATMITDRIHNGGTIVNRLYGTTSISGTKVWIDDGTQTHDNQDEVSLTLWRQAPDGSMEQVPYSSPDSGISLNWSGDVYTFSGLLKYDYQGYAYANYVAEEEKPGYQPNYRDANGNWEEYAENQGKIINIQTIDVSGQKVWDDGKETIVHDNQEEVRLLLQRVIKDVPESREVLEDEEPEWNGSVYTFKGLPAYDSEGHLYTYMVTEEQAEGYEEPKYADQGGGEAPTWQDDAESEIIAYAPNGGIITNGRKQKPEPDPVNRFYFWFTKEWHGEIKDIDFVLYNEAGREIRHRLNRKKIRDGVFLYEAWFSTEGDYYAIEKPLAGYSTLYVNSGEHSGAQDRVFCGGQIINSAIPDTGDSENMFLWLKMTVLALIGLGICLCASRGYRNS